MTAVEDNAVPEVPATNKWRVYAQRVFSTRWEESVAFYRDRVHLPLRFVASDWGWAEFDVGGVGLAIERVQPDDPEAARLVGRLVGISLEVEDLDATYRRLVADGVEFSGPPERQPWGGTLAHFVDPDGNVITLLGARDD